MKLYTIGQIYRLGLLKNHMGKPYTAKAAVSRIVRTMKFKTVKTPFGTGKVVPLSEIQKHNQRWR